MASKPTTFLRTLKSQHPLSIMTAQSSADETTDGMSAILTAFAVYTYIRMITKLVKWARRNVADNLDRNTSYSCRIGDFTYHWGCNFTPVPPELIANYGERKKNGVERGLLTLTETEWWTRADGKSCYIKQKLTPRQVKGNRKVDPGGRGVPQSDDSDEGT
ncbi:MAG: hypothetical protein Q9169_007105 [Polycauliona sp. 2 TL-2023]